MIEQGSIIFDFDGTGNVSAQLTSSLEKEYEKIFRRSRLSVLRNNKNVSNNIVLIVFGCFLMEALCNRIIKTILDNDEGLKKVNHLLWDKLKRSSTLEKLAYIKEYGNKKHSLEYSAFKRNVSDVIELRNKLAHYKDDKEKLAINSALIEDKQRFSTYFDAIPNPKLISELKGEKILFKSDVLFTVFKWLKSFEKYYSEKVLKMFSLNDKLLKKMSQSKLTSNSNRLL